MTLAESKLEKVMEIKGHFGQVDLTHLWFKICFCSDIHIGGQNGKTTLEFKGTMESGLYVLGEVVKACENAGAHCHLEISHHYE